MIARNLSAALALFALPAACARASAEPGGDDGPRGFAAPLQVALGRVPTGLLAYDDDADGVDDLIASSANPGRLRVHRGLSRRIGVGVTVADHPLPGYSLGPILISGAAPRIAMASQSTRELLVLDARRESFAEILVREEIDGIPRRIASGDVDVDGREDVLVLTAGGALVVRHADGAVRSFDLGDELPTCARVLTGGGGLAVGFQASRAVRTFRLAGGEVSEQSKFELGGIPRDLVELDTDGDGRPELIAVGGDDEAWVLGGPDHGPGDPPRRITTGRVPIDAAVLDLDGDGAEELVVLCYADQCVCVIAADLSRPLARIATGMSPLAVTSGDFNGDGALDLAVANGESESVALHFGSLDGFPDAPERVAVSRYPRAVALGDFDGDGASEAFVLGAFEDSLELLRNSAGRLGERLSTSAGLGARALRCGDLDGDGWSDVAFLSGGFEATALVAMLGNGERGLKRDGYVSTPLGREGLDLTVADLDGDGAAECLVADPDEGRVRIVGFGTSRAWTGSIDVGRSALGACAVAAPRDRDGSVRRLAIAVADGLVVVPLELASDGPRSGAPVRVATTDKPCQVIAADLDGDGADDLALLVAGRNDAESGAIHEFLGDGADGWIARPPLPRAGRKVMRLASGDLDGDGRADLVTAAQYDCGVACFLASRPEPAWSLGVSRGPLDVATADLDLDGEIDLVVASSYDHALEVIRGVETP